MLSAEFGQVTGTVKNEEGDPLNATVEVVETGYQYNDQSDLNFYHDVGTYTLKIRASGYETKTQEVEVKNGEPVNLDIVLVSTQGGSVTGEIIDSLTGAPLAGVDITLHQEGEVVSETTSGEQGYYEFLDLDEGHYTLKLNKENYIQESTRLEVGSVPIEQNVELTQVPSVAVLDDYYSSERSSNRC
ncbi:carboxypeptidase-like regulatory domain-containing protein [Piscibacillus salipiscarius]|uniref:carboxypeptidase-like regulatory domain-containing protein n=1 Tax=Piscibacillus salipiscarius TaxID=299480 RepID=UPI00243692DD|nr:carboxypeptidase-like regulatory domain-containing protein [Piscibacillus salipiscarius]